MKADDEKRITEFEIRQLERSQNQLSIFEELNTPAQPLKDVQRRKLQYFGHVVTADSFIAFQLHRRDIAGTRKQGRPRRRWTDDVKDWIGSTAAEAVRAAQGRTQWRSWVSLALTFHPQ